jgi:hypothetical protein
MKAHCRLLKCQCWLLPALAALFGTSAWGQGTIAYFHLPPTTPVQFPWDAEGQQVGPDLAITVNGQTVCTFSSIDPVSGARPFGFVIQPSSLCAVIAQQPYLGFPDVVWTVPLAAGQEIGPGAAGYTWLTGDAQTLASAISSGTIGQPWLTGGYFPGVESAYLGFDFQQAGQTYYGWIRVGAPVVGINAGWVYDYAYETVPNTPIFAGEGVPEPSAAGLGILAAGVSYVFQGRTKPRS